jgi:putative SbcD/Mre11-related phosphoesterase
MIPLINASALYYKDRKTLVIAELHFGFGASTSSQALAESVFESCLSDLKMLFRKYEVEKLIINGDLKETVGTPTYFESVLLKRFNNFLDDNSVEAILVKGNHDGLIENYIDFKCLKTYEFVVSGVKTSFLHGHSLPSNIRKTNELVLAHIHPAIFIKSVFRTFAWIFLTNNQKGLRRITIMPPFNKFVGGGMPNPASTRIFKKINYSGLPWKSYVVGVNEFFYGALEDVLSLA